MVILLDYQEKDDRKESLNLKGSKYRYILSAKVQLKSLLVPPIDTSAPFSHQRYQ